MYSLWYFFGLGDSVVFRANEYQLSDCAKYFLENVGRLGQHGYIPTTQDILHTRVRTSGIVEVKFHIKVGNIYLASVFLTLISLGHDIPYPRRWRSEVREEEVALPL